MQKKKTVTLTNKQIDILEDLLLATLEDDKSLLNVGYSYTIAENRDVVPAFEIVPLKYFEMSLDEIREDIKLRREEKI